MRAQFQSNRPRLGKRGAVFLVATVILIVFVILTGSYVRDVVASFLSKVPEEYALLPRSVLVSRLAAAETEVLHTRYQSILYQDVLRRIQKLEAELDLRPSSAYRAARVIAAPPRMHYDTLLIDSGESDGVLVGDTVSVEGIALGAVTELSSHSSLVALYSSPGATHDAEIGVGGGTVVVYGVGGGALEALMPGDIEVSVGDIVRDVRTGYAFGVVVSVVHRETDTEQYVSIALPVAVSAVSIVSLSHSL